MTQGERRVSVWEIAAFAAPAAPLLALTLPTIIFLPPHFIQHVGLEAWIVGALFFGARVFDIVLDPLIGSWQDRTHTRWGRRRIWIAGSCLPLMALVWWVFIGLEPGASALEAVIAMLAMYFVFALMMVAHLGWAGELIPTYHGRTRVLGAVQLASLVGQTIMLALAGYVVQVSGGSDADAVVAMGWTLIALLPLTTGIAVFGVRETKTAPHAHLGLRDALRTLLQNKVARRVLLPDLLLGIAQGVSGGLFLFYFQFVLGFVREAQTLVAIYFIAGLIGVPLWWWMGQRFGKHRALQVAFVYTAATTACLLIVPAGAFGIVGSFMVLAGLAQGGTVLLTRSLMADVVDEDELATGSRRSGLYFGLLLTTSKVGLASGPLTLIGLQAVGFDGSVGAQNSEAALAALSAMFIGIPITLCLLAALTLRKYPLNEARQAALAAEISARHARNSENT